MESPLILHYMAKNTFLNDPSPAGESGAEKQRVQDIIRVCRRTVPLFLVMILLPSIAIKECDFNVQALCAQCAPVCHFENNMFKLHGMAFEPTRRLSLSNLNA